tara:strand:- start:104 stop:403 length:300 start_codon:yes stop_codon:yes gene_type:complete
MLAARLSWFLKVRRHAVSAAARRELPDEGRQERNLTDQLNRAEMQATVSTTVYEKWEAQQKGIVSDGLVRAGCNWRMGDELLYYNIQAESFNEVDNVWI